MDAYSTPPNMLFMRWRLWRNTLHQTRCKSCYKCTPNLLQGDHWLAREKLLWFHPRLKLYKRIFRCVNVKLYRNHKEEVQPHTSLNDTIFSISLHYFCIWPKATVYKNSPWSFNFSPKKVTNLIQQLKGSTLYCIWAIKTPAFPVLTLWSQK